MATRQRRNLRQIPQPRRRRGSNRNRNENSLVASVLNSENQIVDLTCSVDEDFCDLTESPILQTAQSPVVLLDTPRGNRSSQPTCDNILSELPQHWTVVENEVEVDEELPTFLPFINSEKPNNAVDQENNRQSKSGSAISCPICLDSLPQICARKSHLVSTVCGHVFCQQCIDDVLKSCARSVCPTCRKVISKKTVHKLYI